MLKKNKTRLFRHFITCVNIIACAVPLIVLCFNVLHDFFPKYLTSLGMQHHGSNDNFSEDLSLLSENSQLRDFNTNALSTLDTLGYLDYNESTIITKNVAQTNEVNTINDLVVGNYYKFTMGDFYDFAFNNNYSDAIIIDNVVYCNIDFQNFSSDYVDDSYFFDFYYIYTSFQFYVIIEPNSGGIQYYLHYDSSLLNLSYYCQVDDYSLTSTDNFIFKCDIEFKNSIHNLPNINNYITGLTQQELETYCPITYTEETNDVTSFEGWLAASNGKQLSYIMDNNVNEDSLFLKINFLSLFGIDVTNVNNSVATYLFINYYINYFITITLILFLPQLIFIFIDWVRELLYKFTDVEDRT